MFVSEVKIQPYLETDSASNQQMSKSDQPPPTINIENVINIIQDVPSTSKHVNQTNQPTSPTPSMRSTTISIASIESDFASSVIESDIDEYEDTKTGCMLKKLGQQTANPVNGNPIPNISPEIAVLLGQQIERDVASSDGPKIASLSLTNSTDVTFGQKKYHKGPVTIQQILIEKPKNQGNSNPAFEGSNGFSSTDARTREPQCGTNRDNPPPSQLYKNILSLKIAIITGIMVISILLIAFISAAILLPNGEPQLVDDDSAFPIMSRDEWLAQPPNVPLDNQETPLHRVIITHTVTQNCSTKAMCVFRTRFIQTFDMESRSFDDIRYNFLVGGDGNVYMGRGWDKVGAHTKGYNDGSVGIAFIGTFNKWTPPEEQLNATKALLREGVRLNKLDSDFRLYGSRQLNPSDDGPGDALYDIIKKWPNWHNTL